MKNNSSKCNVFNFHRIFRFLTITAVVLSAFYVSAKASKRYINNWVQTVIDRTDVNIGEIPFPAVSICPLIGINLTNIPEMKIQLLGTNYSAVIEEKLDQQIRRLIYAQKLGDFGQAKNVVKLVNWSEHQGDILLYSDNKYGWKSESTNYNWSDIQKMLIYNCANLFEMCFWRSVELPCCDIFRLTPIYRGYCFSFNMLDKQVIISFPAYSDYYLLLY